MHSLSSTLHLDYTSTVVDLVHLSFPIRLFVGYDDGIVVYLYCLRFGWRLVGSTFTKHYYFNFDLLHSTAPNCGNDFSGLQVVFLKILNNEHVVISCT
jgi:hypothetical protein